MKLCKQFFFLCALVLTVVSLPPAMAFAGAGEVNTQKVNAYKQQLAAMDLRQFAVVETYIEQGRKAYEATFTEQDSLATRDAAFVAYYTFYLQVLEALYGDKESFLSRMRGEQSAAGADSEAVEKAYEDKAKNAGFILFLDSENGYHGVEDIEYFKKAFGPYISPSWDDYFAFVGAIRGYAADGAIFVPVDKLRQYILMAENVLKNSPAVFVDAKVNEDLQGLFYCYINGLDNTLAYGENGAIEPEFKKSYEVFLLENPNSKFYPFIEYLYATLKKNGFKKGKGQFKKMREALLEYDVNL